MTSPQSRCQQAVGRRARGSRVRALAILAVVCLLAIAPRSATGGEPDGPTVELRSGKILRGRVVGDETIQGRRFMQVETDFGRLLVPEKQLTKGKSRAWTPPAVFQAQAVRLVHVTGRVERLPPGAKTWKRVAFKDTYGKRLRFDKIIFPGDLVRTGPKGSADLMLHKGVWVRLAASTEVRITAPSQGAESLRLRTGTTHLHVGSEPRGSKVKVQTPSALLEPEVARFSVQAGDEEEGVSVVKGRVSVQGRGALEAGKKGRWRRKGPWTVTPITGADRAAFPKRFLRYPDDDFVYVPKGKYKLGGMGKVIAQELLTDGSTGMDVRRVSRRQVDAFFIGRTEVSNQAWGLYVRATGRKPPSGWDGVEPKAGTEELPRVQISHREATAYAEWLWLELPTEKQWEAAARGAKGQRYPWGGSPPDRLRLRKVPFGLHTRIRDELLGPVEGPTDDVSPFGCLQMVSNAPEICRNIDNTGVLAVTTSTWGHPDEHSVRGFALSATNRVLFNRGVRAPAGLRVMLSAEDYDR